MTDEEKMLAMMTSQLQDKDDALNFARGQIKFLQGKAGVPKSDCFPSNQPEDGSGIEPSALSVRIEPKSLTAHNIAPELSYYLIIGYRHLLYEAEHCPHTEEELDAIERMQRAILEFVAPMVL